jgi:dihydroxyacid dehydratase/phosphogluconate dehydratase
MEDFYYAGGLRALMGDPRISCRLDALTVSGRPSARRSKAPRSTTTTSSGRLTNPIYHEGALAVLKGNLAPDGCVMKPRLRAAAAGP